MKSTIPIFAVLLALFHFTYAAGATDVNMYGVVKQQNFLQDNPVAPSLSPGGMSDNGVLGFNLFVDGSVAPTSATVQVPGGAVKTATSDSFGTQFKESFGTKLELDTAYPAGTYQVVLHTVHDGVVTANLTLSADNYPNIPFISNYAAAQSVTASSAFTVQFTAAGSAFFVQFTVEDENGQEVYNNSSLTQSSSSVTIPASTLQAGKKYTGKLFFANGNTDTTSYPGGVTGVAAYAKQTEFSLVTVGGTDTVAPYLTASSPNYGDSGIAVNSVIAFEFSEPMQTGVSINWTNVTGANFSYTWSSDHTILFCKYSSNLPQNTQISWGLNASGFHDVAGNALQANPNNGNSSSSPNGYFTTDSQSPGATDVADIGVVKGMTALQTTSSGPVADGGYRLNLFADFNGLNTVTNGTVTWSKGTITPGLDVQNSSDQFGFEAEYASKSDFDTYFPSGTYTVVLNTAHDGNKSVALALPADNYPGLPKVTNFDAAQTVDPAAQFTLSWSGFSGGTSTDSIGVEIRHPVSDETVFHKEPLSGALNGTATQVTIPVGTLAPGRTYKAKLTFVKVTPLNISASYSGPIGVAAYLTETSFTLTTTGTAIKPSLKVLSVDSITHNFNLRLQGERNLQYTIERTFDLINPSWSSVGTMNASNPTNTYEGTFDFTDGGIQSQTSRQFYRAIEGFGSQNNNNNN